MERLVTILWAGAILTGCFSCVGTHGSIKKYAYPHPKAEVERAINALYVREPGMRAPATFTQWQPSSPFFSFYLRGAAPLLYEIRFYGDEEVWKKQPNFSQFSLIYVKEGEAPAKSAPNMSQEEVRKHTSVFEQQIKGRIDALLTEK